MPHPSTQELGPAAKKADEATKEKAQKAAQAEKDRVQAKAANAAVMKSLAFGKSGARWANWGAGKAGGGKPPESKPALAAAGKANGAVSNGEAINSSGLKKPPLAKSASVQRLDGGDQGGKAKTGEEGRTASGSGPQPNSRSLLSAGRTSTHSNPNLIMLKDAIAALEHDPSYCRSSLLYKLYDRLDEDGVDAKPQPKRRGSLQAMPQPGKDS